MVVREFQPDDMKKIHELYTRFYTSNEYHNFRDDFKFACTVLDNNVDNNIIAVGGIKPIIEIAAVCDKSSSVRKRREALLHILQTSIYSAQRFGYKELHVFSNDSSWTTKLISADFKDRGSVLTLEI